MSAQQQAVLNKDGTMQNTPLKTLFLVLVVLTCICCTTQRDWEKMNQEVDRLYNEMKFPEAEKLARAALAEAERVHGLEHERVARSLHNLATILKAREQYKEASQCFDRSLAIKKKILPDDDPSIANTLNNLAVLYASEGDLIRAESHLKEALRIYQISPGKNQAGVLSVLENLVKLYTQLGDPGEASKYQEQLNALAPHKVIPQREGY